MAIDEKAFKAALAKRPSYCNAVGAEYRALFNLVAEYEREKDENKYADLRDNATNKSEDGK